MGTKWPNWVQNDQIENKKGYKMTKMVRNDLVTKWPGYEMTGYCITVSHVINNQLYTFKIEHQSGTCIFEHKVISFTNGDCSGSFHLSTWPPYFQIDSQQNIGLTGALKACILMKMCCEINYNIDVTDCRDNISQEACKCTNRVDLPVQNTFLLLFSIVSF